jgi:hypothetical protein
MSGPGSSGGGGGTGFGGGRGGSSVDCQDISIKTSIVSPDPPVLATLSKGDLLAVTLRSATGPLIATTKRGKILGAVFTINPTLLIDCINQGFSYQAEILSISGGDCEVLITAV